MNEKIEPAMTCFNCIYHNEDLSMSECKKHNMIVNLWKDVCEDYHLKWWESDSVENDENEIIINVKMKDLTIYEKMLDFFVKK